MRRFRRFRGAVMTGIRDQAAPGRLPDGRRIYAVGDVHGCVGALAALHGLIATDLAQRPIERPLLLHVGDFIDRGPDSAGVIARLLDPAQSPVAETIHLRGNHEDMLLGALDGDAELAALWLDNGGDATLRSWGIPAPAGDPAEWPAQWRDAIPAEQQNWLRALHLFADEGGYRFCHAGVRPEQPFADQTPHDMVWIREPFLGWRGKLERVVVHGHTPAGAVEIRPHRIGVDTGAVFGHRLSCAVLEADRISVLSVPGGT